MPSTDFTRLDRADILGREFTHLGVGFTGGGPAGTYGTRLFGG
ncbi:MULTISPECIES: hypothetical protein [Streptomyces]|nr:hypothetical protein [Streptomyces sp. PBH53]